MSGILVARPKTIPVRGHQSPAHSQHVYEIYRGRGDVENRIVENRIKEWKDGLALDRLSCSRFLGNQLRLLLTLAAMLALEAVRQKRKDRYDRFVRPLDRKRDELAAQVATRAKALSGGQHAEARRILVEYGA